MPSALITGANRGLGLEFVRQYLADGWRAYAACRDSASASELRRLAEGSDDKLRILAMDVTDPASIHAAATQLDGQAIDLLLNNAGIIGPRGQTIGNIDYEAWADVLAVNTMGPMRVSEAFVEHVARSDRKLIVTLTSGMGSIADNTSGGSIVYRSSKAAMNMVMRAGSRCGVDQAFCLCSSEPRSAFTPSTRTIPPRACRGSAYAQWRALPVLCRPSDNSTPIMNFRRTSLIEPDQAVHQTRY